MEPILSASNISKSFIGVRALNNIDITINAGEIHCLAGENGCGKSTLVKCISGVYTPDEGTIQIEGQTCGSMTPIEAMNHGIQVIYQDLSLFQHMTVAENIAISKLKFENTKIINWKTIKAIAKEQLDKIGVTMDLDETVGEISMANKQMVAICRALAQNAKILFMDEPFGALDAITRMKLQKDVLKIAHETDKTVVFVTHDIEEAIFLADRIVIMSANPGKIKSIMKVTLPKDRDRTSDDFLLMRDKVYEIFQMKEERNIEYFI